MSGLKMLLVACAISVAAAAEGYSDREFVVWTEDTDSYYYYLDFENGRLIGVCEDNTTCTNPLYPEQITVLTPDPGDYHTLSFTTTTPALLYALNGEVVTTTQTIKLMTDEDNAGYYEFELVPIPGVTGLGLGKPTFGPLSKSESTTKKKVDSAWPDFMANVLAHDPEMSTPKSGWPDYADHLRDLPKKQKKKLKKFRKFLIEHMKKTAGE